jgi:hypothetical protein
MNCNNVTKRAKPGDSSISITSRVSRLSAASWLDINPLRLAADVFPSHLFDFHHK